jgi:hypothetical protein
MPFTETVVVCSNNHMKLVNLLCRENVETSNVKEFAAHINNMFS